MQLRKGETITHSGQPHWIVFGWKPQPDPLSVFRC
jgi:hypothetical protein